MFLPYDPRRFLEIANRLLLDSNYERQGRIRTAIGRAYYAAFLLSMKKLQELGHSFRRIHRLHKDVIDTLMKSRYYSIGSKLNTLFEYRVDADYKMESRITPELGKLCIRLSEHIISSIEQL